MINKTLAKVTLKLIGPGEVTFDIKENTTVAELQEVAEKYLRVKAAYMKLKCDGVALDPMKYLKIYNIEDGDEINVLNCEVKVFLIL